MKGDDFLRCTVDIEIWVGDQEHLVVGLHAVTHFDFGGESKVLKKGWFCQVI